MANDDSDKFGIQSNTERVLLARALAGNEKDLRDKAVEQVAVLLQGMDREDEIEYLKLWKALFYCYWMSDKMDVQEQLATFLSKLIHRCKTPEQCERFVGAFFKTIQKQWLGLDKHRVDKFLMLIEFFVKELFAFCKEAKWSQESVDVVNDIIGDVVLSNQPDGVRFHVADISLDQLVAVAPQITTQQFTDVARPFYRVLSGVGDHSVFKKVCLEFFHPLTGILKDNLKEISGQLEKEAATNDASLKTMQNRASEIREQGLSPMGQLDPSHLANSVFDIASDPSTPQGRRKTLYSMHGSLKRLSQKYNQTFASGGAVSTNGKETTSSNQESGHASSSISSKKAKEDSSLQKGARSQKKKNKAKKRSDASEEETQTEVEIEDSPSVVERETPRSSKKKPKTKTTALNTADAPNHSEIGLNGSSPADKEAVAQSDESTTPTSAKKKRAKKLQKRDLQPGDVEGTGDDERVSTAVTPEPASMNSRKKNSKKSKSTDMKMSELVSNSIASAERQLTEQAADEDADGAELLTPRKKGKKTKEHSRSTGKKRDRDEATPKDSSTKSVRLAPDKNSEVSYSKSTKSLKRKLPRYSEREPTVTKGVLKNSPSSREDFLSSLPSMSDLEKESWKTPKKGKKQKKSK